MSTQTNAAPQSVRAQFCSDVDLKVVASRHERQEAFELTYNAYLRAGLCEANESGMRATEYQLQPTTDVFVAKLREEVISTVSLVRDSERGLPMEAVFPEVVAERRAAGMRVAEVSCLADRRADPGRFFQMFIEIGRLMAQLAAKEGVDEFLVVVHPRHAGVYRRFMAFRRVGELRDYSSVRGNPAVALVLNFAEANARTPEIWNRYFSVPLPEEVLISSPPTLADCEYYRSVMSPAETCGPYIFAGHGQPASSDDAELMCA